MTSPRTRRAALAAALAAAVLVPLTACGGGGTPAASAGSPQEVPSGSATPSGSPSVSGSASASSTPSAASTGGSSDRSSAGASSANDRALPTCSNTSQLAGWSDRRLAMLTIAVPVDENRPSDVDAEVSAGVGGVLLFGSSAPTDLGARLAALKSHVPGRLGLLVMTDEEGGDIQRMANLVGSLPWGASMENNWSTARIQQETKAVAQRMAAAGVNMDLAPVVDVDGTNAPPSASNPDGWRSFSGDPAAVSRDGVAYMKGMQAGGVIPVVKHFPGIGGSSYNSDLGPAHTLPWSTLQNVGLPPFAATIGAGAQAVMVSNDTVPGLTSTPAGLSPTVINGELKGKLGFKGLVITDALDAKAISAAGYSVPSATVQALRAGADMIMFSLGPDVQGVTDATATAITTAVADGQLSRSRLIDAADAVLTTRHVDLCH